MHETVELWNPIFGRYIDIDKNIAPLISELWKACISTSQSCENNCSNIYDHKDECIWIAFSSASDLEKFIGIISNGSNFCLDGRFWGFVGDFVWKYSIVMDCDKIGYSLRFPGRDYDYVLKRVVEYNKISGKIIKVYNKMKTFYYPFLVVGGVFMFIYLFTEN